MQQTASLLFDRDRAKWQPSSCTGQQSYPCVSLLPLLPSEHHTVQLFASTAYAVLAGAARHAPAHSHPGVNAHVNIHCCCPVQVELGSCRAGTLLPVHLIISTCGACVTCKKSNQNLTQDWEMLTLTLQHPYLRWLVTIDAYPLHASPLHNIAQLVCSHKCLSSSHAC